MLYLIYLDIVGYNDPAARGILGLMSARVPPKLSEDCRLRRCSLLGVQICYTNPTTNPSALVYPKRPCIGLPSISSDAPFCQKVKN